MNIVLMNSTERSENRTDIVTFSPESVR